MQGIDSDLIRGHIDTIILKVLFEGDKYGYEICKEVEEKSGGTYELKQPTLYSCLKRLETQGLISSYWEESDIGGKRHYYKLTDEGKKTFQENYDEWTRSRQIIDNLISNPYVKAKSYALVNRDELNELEKKAEAAENLETETATNDSEEATEEKIEAEPIADKQESQPSLVDDILRTTTYSDETDVIPWATESEQTEEESVETTLNNDDEKEYVWETETKQDEEEPVETTLNDDEQESDGDYYQNYTWFDEDDGMVATTGNGEPVEAFPAKAEVTEEEQLSDNELPFEEVNEVNKAQASFFEDADEIEDEKPYEEPLIEHNDEIRIEHNDEVRIEHNDEEKIDYETRPLLDAPAEDESPTPFVFDVDAFTMQTNSSYFASDEINEPTPDYVAPEMKIDGLEETAAEPEKEEKIEEKTEESEPQEVTPNVIYHDFGADTLIKKKEDEIWVDDSELDADSIYLNPDEAKEVPEDQLNLFSEDIIEENSAENVEEKVETEDNIIEEQAEPISGNSKFMDFYKSTDSYDKMDPSYTDEQYREKLSSLMQYSTEQPAEKQKETYVPVIKDYTELKNEFEKEGLVVRPHRKFLKEAKETRSYIESNKINLVTSWTAFGIISFLLTLTYFITTNYSSSINVSSYIYFLVGIAILAIVPIIYSILFFINPYKKKPARYAFRIYMLFAILLTVQLLIINYCVNLQLGFYSFSQPTYNHFLWIVPAIMSLYPIADAILHNVYFKSKNFHV